MPAPLPTKSSKPNALEIFTDRVEQQKLLRELISQAPSPSLGAKALLTQFYGVGGVGKSTLYLRALEIVASEFKEHVVVVATCFDDNRWAAGTPFTEVLAELCRCLVEQKIIPQITLALLSLHGQQTGRNGEVVGGLDAGWHMAFTAMEKGADLTGIPGLGMVVKGAQWVRERSQRHALRQRLVDLGLWPEEAYGKLNILDLEKKLSSALFYDLVDWLRAHPQHHLRFLLDGFERLQSSERREDAQRRLQEFVGFFASPDNRDACERCRVVIFGRNLLRWDEIYEDPSWREYWNLHLLGGLAEADARDFLKKTRVWLAAKGQSTLSDTLLKYEEKILDAADETVGGHRVFYPFYLKLAVELVERAQQAGKEFELGRAPAELQDRFFRYLEPRELRALMILALSEVFDEALFDWLAKERFIEYPQHSFHSQLRREHSYIQPVEGHEGEWRFHRIMEDALHARWHTTPELKREGSELLKRILDYYAAPLMARPERDWSDREIELWRRGTEIIVKQGTEKELLGHGIWSALIDEKPWSIEHYRCLETKINFIGRILKHHERVLGAVHIETAKRMTNLGKLLCKSGDFNTSKMLFKKSAEISESILGTESLTLENQHGIAVINFYEGDYVSGEKLSREVYAQRTQTLGEADPLTRKSEELLAICLAEQGAPSEAESIFVKSVELSVKHLGANHASTLNVISNLAELNKRQGKLDNAEALLLQVLTGFQETLGEENPETHAVEMSIACVLITRGDIQRAVNYMRRSLRGIPSISALNGNFDEIKKLCETLTEQGDCKTAVELMDKYSSKHPLCLAKSRYYLASCKCAVGDFQDAKRLIADEIFVNPDAFKRALMDDGLKPIHGFVRSISVQ